VTQNGRSPTKSGAKIKSKFDFLFQFGEESYDEESDMYSKTCSTCGHTLRYEKM